MMEKIYYFPESRQSLRDAYEQDDMDSREVAKRARFSGLPQFFAEMLDTEEHVKALVEMEGFGESLAVISERNPLVAAVILSQYVCSIY